MDPPGAEGYPGFWSPGIPRVIVSFPGSCLIFPCHANQKRKATQEVIKRMIQELEALVTEKETKE